MNLTPKQIIEFCQNRKKSYRFYINELKSVDSKESFDNLSEKLFDDIFDDEELPEWVQIWQPSCEKADILIISSHADDEILFFGGIMPTYIPNHITSWKLIYNLKHISPTKK